MISERLLIHIGYPKTASTWLQQVIFNNEKTGFVSPWGFPADEAIEQFVLPNVFRFNPESARKVFEPGLEDAARRNLIPVLSNEILAGDQTSGKYWGKEVAERIYAIFPNARILMCIREQKSIIISSYREYVKLGGTETLEKFTGAGEHKPGYAPKCRLDYLEYDLLIEYYQKLFSADNILVLPFELLKKDPQAFIQKFFSFANSNGSIGDSNAAKNVGAKGASLAFQRYLNFICGPAYFGIGGPSLSWRFANKVSKLCDRVLPDIFHKPIEDNWKRLIDEYVGDYFCSSNQRTSHLIKLNLVELGYP